MLSRLTAALFSFSAAAASLPPSSSALQPRADLPESFSWNSSGPLVGPQDDGRDIAGIKDPSVVLVDGTYHVFASTAQASGYNLVTFSFTAFDQAGDAEFFYLDTGSGIGTGYRAAPQVFYFEPQALWYLIYQNGNAAYSTNPDINDPAGWSAPTTFFSDMPAIIAENIGDGYWVDMWVICDETDCHLYSSDDNGHLYRASTAIDAFPEGMDNTVISMQDSRNALFEASNVYKVAESDEYLLIVEAIGSGGTRYFRSWTATDLASDTWTPLADSEDNPFAGAANVDFPADGGQWTESISHGEMVRDHVDQSLTVSACDMRYMYQGVDPDAGGDYNSLPWRLGLLTQTNSPC